MARASHVQRERTWKERATSIHRDDLNVPFTIPQRSGAVPANLKPGRCAMLLSLEPKKDWTRPHMPVELETGFTLDARYRIENKIGAGANGAVYRATDVSLNRPVAIKILLNWNTSFTDETNTRRFEREARVLSQLNHPNIIRVFSFGHMEDGNPYLVMEFLDGQSLRELIEQKKQIPCNEAIEIALQICAALEVAHSHDIIHRDLKPENVVINYGNSAATGALSVKILDFGLCKTTSEYNSEKTLTETGYLIGTVNYMSPEQSMGKGVDSRSDIYSFGCIVYEMITGNIPFSGETAAIVLLQHIKDATPPFLDLSPRSKLPSELQDLVLTATAKKKEERYQSFSELRRDLLEISRKNCRNTYLPPKGGKAIRPNKLNTKSISVISAIFLAGTLAIGAFIFGTDKGSLFLSDQIQSSLSPPEANTQLSKLFDEQLTLGQEDRAQQIMQNSLSSPVFKGWTIIDQEKLLFAFRDALLKHGQDKKAFLVDLKILKIALDSGFAAYTARRTPDKEECDLLEKICSDLSSRNLSKREWSQIALSLPVTKRDFRRPLPDFMRSLDNLQYEAYKSKEGSTTQEGLSELKFVCTRYSGSLSREHRVEQAERNYKECIARSKQFGQLGAEFALRVELGILYINTGKMDLAKKELAIVDPIHPNLLLSGSDSEKFEAFKLGCKLGSLPTPEEIQKIHPELQSVKGAKSEVFRLLQ